MARAAMIGGTVALASLSACGEGVAPALNNVAALTPSDNLNLDAGSSVAPAASAVSAKDRARICRAAIAGINGHPPGIVKLVSSDADGVRVKYARPSDGKLWTNECRFDGNRVVWRTVDAFGPGSGLGRWRNGPDDETITFEIKGPKIALNTAYPDGSGGTETYSVN